MLVAKVLTNLSNGLSFGKKERYLMDMNEFIVKNQIELLSYLGAMGGVRERVDPLLKSLHLSEISVVCEVGEEEAHGEEEGEEQISGEIGDQPIEQYVTRLNHSQGFSFHSSFFSPLKAFSFFFSFFSHLERSFRTQNK